ncbi:hypothetical protein HDU76_001741 [Blyttiomyces sp. JEL0837]|nr:hypothetical protein HDU76_001741 [Blyttiomyces sp. JEL0837]
MISVIPVPVNADNYAYLLLTDSTAKTCAAVDPAEADKVLAAATKLGWKITTILTTHHHHDHCGGNENLVELLKEKKDIIVGGDERIQGLKKEKVVNDRQGFNKSISFYVTDPKSDDKVVFTGDTLFVGGCGRFFEGTPDQMHNSLNKVLGSLPGDTKVYPGHEYTVSNLKFAASIEPKNPDVINKLAWAQSVKVTVPSTIADEKKFNPFMRVEVKDVVEAVAGVKGDGDGLDAVEVMGRLRELKNGFRG